MELRLIEPEPASPQPRTSSVRLRDDSRAAPIAQLFFDDARRTELVPELCVLSAALLELASGRRSKALLPLGDSPTELALHRDREQVLVSAYETTACPEVLALDRPVLLRNAIAACEGSLRTLAAASERNHQLEKLADALATVCIEAPPATRRVLVRRGGAAELPESGAPLAFGFRALISCGSSGTAEGAAQADVHALLFVGSLWAFVRGHKITLVDGPVMPAAQRMVAAVGALVDAWELGRALNVRLRAGDFGIGVRLERSEDVAVTLFANGRRSVTASHLNVQHAALPILRVASDLLRALVTVDRSQSRNPRVGMLRDEVRGLRDRIRARGRARGFVNRDAERLRASDPNLMTSGAAPACVDRPVGTLRFRERWSLNLDELDAAATYLCGDRLVTGRAGHVVAFSRESGELLWVRHDSASTTWMAGTTLVRLSPGGQVDLCDLEDGETVTQTRVAPRIGSASPPLHVSGAGFPPMVVLPEGARRLVAVDLRTGQLRWRLVSRSPGAFRVRRKGRVLVVVGGDATIDAIDAVSGELVWRSTERARFVYDPAIVRDTVVAVSGELNGYEPMALGVDLYSGEIRWRTRLRTVPRAAPIALGNSVVVAMGPNHEPALCGLDAETGEVHWEACDPGIGAGGATLGLDDRLLVNAPGGRVSALDAASGRLRWSRTLADPVADDVPRRLEAILRGGALFVPAASIHILRPSDGASLGSPLSTELVPDFVRVDERGWVYAAEESGLVRAYAPAPNLSVVEGGKRDSTR